MSSRSVWRRILCLLGLHLWHGLTLAGEGAEGRRCVECGRHEWRELDDDGYPVSDWQAYEELREPWGPEWY